MTSSTINKFILIALIATSACGWLRPFSPSAPLEEKWKRVENWVPSNTSYFFLIDINKAAKTAFYKNAIEGSKNKYLSLLSGINPETEAGIIALTDKFMFIGGNFEATDLTNRIKESLGTEKGSLAELVYKKKTLYIDKVSNTAFAMLEKYLICHGNPEEIKKLIDEKRENKIEPIKADTSYMIWGRAKRAHPMVLSAELADRLQISISAQFPTEREATLFEEEAIGIKTIKSLEYMDEPWLADLIDGVKISKTEDKVIIKAGIDVPAAKKLIKRGLK